MSDFTLHRNRYGRLVLTGADGIAHDGVVAVRAFPIAAPDEGVSLVGADGHELAWIPHLDRLDAERSRIVTEELAQREFMPVVTRLHSVSSFAMPSTWHVATDRGEAHFVLRGEEDIRRIGPAKILIADSHGIQYLVPDLFALDAHSRKLLDRFL